MMAGSLLYKKEIPVNNGISVIVPTVGSILDNEDEYYGLVSVFTAMPIDMMVELDDAGIDFTTINEYDLFLYMFATLRGRDISLVLSGINFSELDIAQNQRSGEVVLVDKDGNVAFDRSTHINIANTLRMIHHLEKDMRKPVDKATRNYMIDRARRKRNRRRNHQKVSQLESLIIALVNTEQFSYDFESVQKMTIYQFNESVRQVIKKIDYDNRMHGIYAGTVSLKDMSQDDLNWLVHK